MSFNQNVDYLAPNFLPFTWTVCMSYDCRKYFVDGQNENFLTKFLLNQIHLLCGTPHRLYWLHIFCTDIDTKFNRYINCVESVHTSFLVPKDDTNQLYCTRIDFIIDFFFLLFVITGNKAYRFARLNEQSLSGCVNMPTLN